MTLIPFKTRSQLAQECAVHLRTVSRKFEQLAPHLPKRQRLSPSYQKLFYVHYGWPSSVDRSLYENIPLPPPPAGY